MPPRIFASLLIGVFAAAGVTIALATSSGVPLAVLGLAALVAGVVLRLWKRRP